jgi:MraZ protein
LAFLGHFEHSLDAKNRLSIPARFRAAFAGGAALGKDPDGCVTVWPLETHTAMVERAFAGLNPMGTEYRKLSRFYQGNSFVIEPDGSGRVTLPSQLLEHGSIEKEVVVAGVGNHLEVWSRDGWQREQEQLDAGIEEVTARLGNPS